MKQRLQSPIMSMSNVDITDAMNALERNTNLLQTENITSHEYTIECITERERTSICETNIPKLVHSDQIFAKEKEMIELNNILLDSFKTCTSVWNSIDLEMMELNESYLVSELIIFNCNKTHTSSSQRFTLTLSQRIEK